MADVLGGDGQVVDDEGFDVEGFIFLCLVGWIVFAGFGAWIAAQKNREQGEGMALGCLFGPFGVLIEALLPTLPSPERRDLAAKRVAILTPEEAEAVRLEEAIAQTKREADAIALQEFRRQQEAKQQAHWRALAEQDRLEAERRIRLREEMQRLRKQKRDARWNRLHELPEGAKVLIGLILGIAGIAALFAIVLLLVGK